LEVDGWGLDAVYSGTQKCLACPPGLSPVTFSDRALRSIEARKSKVQSWYFDMTVISRYWGTDRFYHHTAPISMVYALREGLGMLLDEGLEARWARHMRHHRALRAGLEAMGLRYLTTEGHILPQLNCVGIPDGVDDLTVRKRLATEFGIEIGGGLGPLKGKAWRIGLMGHSSRMANVVLLLGALEICLRDCGVKFAGGASLAAASEAAGSGA
jgi:alanine-glyoxylate transaminase/serine-glyoxylate transaminase/serine-pyruvate transaminase